MILVAVGTAASARAAQVRVRSNAVVRGDRVFVADVCDVTQLPAETRRALADAEVARAPDPGQAFWVGADLIRTSMRSAGVNPARTVLIGASECKVVRSAEGLKGPDMAGRKPRLRGQSGPTAGLQVQDGTGPRRPGHVSGLAEQKGAATLNRSNASRGQAGADLDQNDLLKQAVRAFLDEVGRRHGGRVDVRFDSVLKSRRRATSSPVDRYVVRLSSKRWLGQSVRLNVDGYADGRRVEERSIQVDTQLVRPVVVAARSVNMNQTLADDDVRVVERRFDSLNRALVDDPKLVVGRRAKKFIPAGRAIDAGSLEAAPLVLRGQLVDVVSAFGSVEVRAVAQAQSDAVLGESVELRAGGRRGRSMTGVVVGYRRVRIGGSAGRGSGSGDMVAALDGEVLR